MLSAFAFQEHFQDNPSWEAAFDVALTVCPVPDHVSNIFRLAWSGLADSEEMIRVIGFSKLNPLCLLNASGQNSALPAHTREELAQAIQFLGIRFSAVVLAVNLFGRSILGKNPPASWQRLFEDCMRSIEIGYLFGQRSSAVGSAGGALAGFSQHVGLLALMVAKPKGYIKYLMLLKSEKHVSDENFRDVFGCEPWQVSALILQQLGFGSDLAFGCSIIQARTKFSQLELSPQQLHWKAAALWVESLRMGRNYPAEAKIRNFFPELAPPKKGARNQNLESLYTEVAKLRDRPSKWTWHLPRDGYERTKESLAGV